MREGRACTRKRNLKAINACNVSTWAQAYRVFPYCENASAGQIHLFGRRGIEGAIDSQLQACAQCRLGQQLFGGPRSVPTNMSCSCPAGAGEINQLRDTGKFPREMESFLLIITDMVDCTSLAVRILSALSTTPWIQRRK